MLCAFFEKRISDSSLLFTAFWSRVGGDDATFLEGQWKVEEEWIVNAKRDGSLDTLRFLSYRINRLCALLALVDCWSSSIGRCLGFWLDSHVHLVRQCEEKKSGPSREFGGEERLYLYDWRYVPESSLEGIVKCLGGGAHSGSARSQSFFSRVMHSVTTNKQLVNILRDFANDSNVKMSVCSAVTRCFLGGMADGETPMNAFRVRRKVHALAGDGIDAYYEQICKETERQKRPITLICIREYVIKQVTNDLLLESFLSSKEKMVSYVNNTNSAAESMRMMFKAAKNFNDDLSYTSVLAWAGFEAPQNFFTGFCRSARRVPGLLSRDNSNKLLYPEACKIIRKERDKRRSDNSIVTERFDQPDAEGRKALFLCRDLRANETLSLDHIRTLAGSNEHFEMFLSLVRAVKSGKSTLQKFISEYSETIGVAGDCLSAFQTSCDVKSFRLPPTYAEMQRGALERRFNKDAEKIKRGSRLLCCLACSTVKNFVVGGKAKGNPATSHGFKRVCHDGRRLMCDEKRLYACCKTVPLKEYVLVDEEASHIVEYMHKAYVVSTCCGHITELSAVAPFIDSPMTCKTCVEKATKRQEESHKEVEKCWYCEKKITKTNKGFRGMFVNEDEEEVELVFCKSHTRSYMKKEFEPMRLNEIKEAISRGVHI